MTKRRKKSDSRAAKIAEASGLLKRASKILDDLEGEQPEPETPLERLSRRSFESASRLYPQEKKPRKSKKKSQGKSGNT